MQFSIRKARKEDHISLVRLFGEIHAIHCEALPDVFCKLDSSNRDSLRKFLMDAINNEDSAIFVAETDDRIVGLLHIYIQHPQSNVEILVPRRFARIDAVGVERQFQRQGVGSALLDYAHRWALQKGINQIELNVWEFNKGAIAFYENLGYKTARRVMWIKLDKENPLS